MTLPRAWGSFVALACACVLGGCSQGDFTTEDEGGDGSGGTTSTGGTTGSGGSTTEGSCGESELTFKVEHQNPARNCMPAPGCGPSWITIRDASGNEYPQDSACQVSCDDCSPTACPDVECSAVPFDRELAFTFTGDFFAESTCDSDLCAQASCAAPGDYEAEICFDRAVPPENGATECISAGVTECETFDFTWPLPDGMNQILTITLGAEGGP